MYTFCWIIRRVRAESLSRRWYNCACAPHGYYQYSLLSIIHAIRCGHGHTKPYPTTISNVINILPDDVDDIVECGASQPLASNTVCISKWAKRQDDRFEWWRQPTGQSLNSANVINNERQLDRYLFLLSTGISFLVSSCSFICIFQLLMSFSSFYISIIAVTVVVGIHSWRMIFFFFH